MPNLVPTTEKFIDFLKSLGFEPEGHPLSGQECGTYLIKISLTNPDRMKGDKDDV